MAPDHLSHREQVLAPGSIIGILGGGQLGRMLAVAASRLGLITHIYSPHADCPAALVAQQVSVGEFDDVESVYAFSPVSYTHLTLPTILLV